MNTSSSTGTRPGAEQAPRRPKVNIRILAMGLAVIVPLVAILASGFGNDPRALPSVLVGREAPPFQLVDLEGNTWSSADLEGQPIILNFWSTWCGPCKYEHPLLLQAARERPDVKFFGVLYSDQPDKAKRYLDKAGSAYPTLIDPNNGTATDFGVAGVPETFFIDRNGVIVHKHAGAVYPQLMLEKLTEISKP